MPAIGENGRNFIAKKKRKPRVKPTSRPAPRPQGMSRSFTPSGKAKPAPKSQPRSTTRTTTYTLPKTYRTEAAVSEGYRPVKHQRAVVKKNVRKARKRVQRTQRINRAATQKFGLKGQLKAQRRVKQDFARLRLRNPKAYEKNLKTYEDARKNFIEDVIKPGASDAQKALNKAAEVTKSGVDTLSRVLEGRGKNEARNRLAMAGPDPTKLSKEAADLVATTPAGVYMAGAALKEAATGDTKRAKSMWKDFKKTSAIPPLVTGHPKEALKRANERPLSTVLELSGAKALVGRGAGLAARAGVAGKAGKEFASTERAPLRLYEGSEPGEGPAVARRYSKDLIDNRIQKARDRRKVRKGRDPDTYREPKVKNLSGGETPVKPSVGPMKHPLDDRVDRHVHAMHVMQEQAIRQAEKRAKKRGRADEPMTHRAHRKQVSKKDVAAQEAKVYTLRNPRVNGLDPEAIARQAHDVLGIKKPVVVRLMTAKRAEVLRKHLGKEPRGYTDVFPDHYRIEINPRHEANKGPKGLSNVMHYELGRVQAEERGITGPGAVGSRDREAYFKNPNTQHAQDTMRRYIGTDLRNPPPRLPELEFEGSPRPTRRDEAGQRAAQSAQQTHMRNVVKDFGIRIGRRGHVGTYDEAKLFAASESKRLGEKMIPVNEARLTRIPQEPVVPRSADRHGLRLATSQERAWKQAVENHSNGRWVLMPERVVKRFIQHAENSRNYGTLQRTTNQFKDVVLTTSNPVRWLGGNLTDLTMRSVLEGLTPADLYRGARVHRELSRRGRKGRLVQASTMGGGFGHLARDISREIGAPGVGRLAKAWGAYRSGVYGIESAIESLPQMATVGKEMRTGVKPELKSGLKGLLRATDEQVQHFATTLTRDPAVEMQVARHVEDVIGKWGKLSPEARRALAAAPFAQWLGAATKYVLVTLPTKHPIKTGILAAIDQMTEKERMALGFSNFLPLDKQVQDYQMMVLPQHVSRDKYGPVVKGTDLARALSMGTVNDALGLNVGGFLFPQFSGALQAAQGVSWTGEPLRYPEGDPRAGMELSREDKRNTAIGFLIEAMTPGASAFRRVVQEKGQPSLPQSNILNPQVRPKYDKRTKSLKTPEGSTAQGIERLIGWPVPGLPQPKRVYTKGAVNQIERSRTAIQEVKGWNKRRSEEAARSKKTGDPEIDAFGSSSRARATDPEVSALGGHRRPRRKNADPEVEAFK